MRKFYFLFCLFFSFQVSAQVEFSGILDVGGTIGGKNSNQLTNGLSNKYPNFNIQSFSLFMFSPLSDNFNFNGKLSYNPMLYGAGSYPRLVFANVSWDPEGETYGIAVGKILTPFGLFPKKQHSTDNMSFLPPLVYSYFVNVDPNLGYWPKAGDVGSYASDDKVGTPTIFGSGYQMGLKAYYSYDYWFESEIALTNSPVSVSAEQKSNNAVSVVTRLGFKPVIWYNFGVSFGYGSYMQDIPELESEGKYKQMTVGFDYTFAYSYFELSGEYIFNQWTAPKFANEVYQVGTDFQFLTYTLQTHSGYLDLKVSIPDAPGLFVGSRVERIYFPTFKNPKNVAVMEKWDNDIDRYTLVVGYRLSKEVLFKVIGFKQKSMSGNIEPRDDAGAFQVSISF